MLEKVPNAESNLTLFDEYDVALQELDAAKDSWVQKSVAERIHLLGLVCSPSAPMGQIRVIA